MILETFQAFLYSTGIANITYQSAIMIVVALFFLYLAIKKGFEPLLLVPIAFGMLLANLPVTGIFDHPVTAFDVFMNPDQYTSTSNGGLLYLFYMLNKWGILPPLIFLGIGAMTDFGPLIANPKSLLLGAAAQFGIFTTFLGAVLVPSFIPSIEFNAQAAASIGIIGGADGPTAIYLTTQLAPELLAPIAVAAYSYMALVPVIQPPIMKALTTKAERQIRMEQLREVSQREKILFPILVTIVVVLILPPAAPLVGMLMLGNLFKESMVTVRLSETAANALINIVTIILGISVGASAQGEVFITAETLLIVVLGILAFAIGTAAGVLLAKLMNVLTGGKINPLIGSAGVSAVPMAARVSQKVGGQELPGNFLLMHAMGPNVAGVIGSAVAAGVMLSMFSGY